MKWTKTNLLLISIKVDKGRRDGPQMWIKEILIVNIINLTKVDKGGGVKTLIHKKVDNLPFLFRTLCLCSVYLTYLV